MSRQTLPAADAAWLHMDRSTNPMVVNGLNILAEAPDPDRVATLLEQRLLDRFPRFRQRIVDPLGRSPAFEDDPAFDLDDHLHRVALPAPGDRAALQRMLGDLVSQPLSAGKPLWHAYLIEGYGEGAAILWRIHHCIGDGIALSQVMLSLTEGGDGSRTPVLPPPPRQSMLGEVVGLPGRAGSAARGGAAAAVHEGIETLAHPDHLRRLAGIALQDAGTVAKLLAAPADPPSGLRRPLSGTRRVAWSEPVPLAEVRDAARLQRVTINDVLVAALAAAVREVLAVGGEVPEEIHAMVPFNLRPLDQPIPAELGNDFALILLTLPLGDVTLGERLRLVSRRMDEIKGSHEAPIAYGLITTIGITPPWAEDRLIGFFTDKASLVVTNVPGPREQLSFAGVPIRSVLVWAPCSGSLGLTVSIFSYDGDITVGFMADTALIADPEALAKAYERQVKAYSGKRA
ncbi:MAG: wax ester/triacylglycerol synthase family O-acyltransferase [Solirubrobacterales bacterium]